MRPRFPPARPGLRGKRAGTQCGGHCWEPGTSGEAPGGAEPFSWDITHAGLTNDLTQVLTVGHPSRRLASRAPYGWARCALRAVLSPRLLALTCRSAFGQGGTGRALEQSAQSREDVPTHWSHHCLAHSWAGLCGPLGRAGEAPQLGTPWTRGEGPWAAPHAASWWSPQQPGHRRLGLTPAWNPRSHGYPAPRFRIYLEAAKYWFPIYVRWDSAVKNYPALAV